jgi:hypothetical protein
MKILPFAGIIFLSIFGRVLQAQPSLVLAAGTTSPGSPATLALSLTSNGASPSALQWTFSYPSSSVTNFSVTAGPALTAAGKSIQCAGTADSYTCMAYGLNQTLVADGTIATVSLTPASGAATFSIGLSQGMAADSSGTAIPLSTTGANLNVTVPAVTPSISALTCTSASLTPNSAAACTVTLSPAVPAGGATVKLSSSNSAVSVTPSVITLPAGSSSASFTATVGSFTAPQSAVLTATLGTSSQSAALSLVFPGTLTSLTCSSSMIYAGAKGTCTVTLLAALPSGTTVVLTSSNPLLQIPAIVGIPASSNAATFAFATDPKLSASAVVTATLGPVSKTFAFSVTTDTTPPTISLTAPQSGATLAQTITLTANATCGLALNNVQFKLDGANLGSAVSGSGPWYTLSWNTLTASDGPHVLSAVASNVAGVSGASNNLSVTVANSVGPVISLVTATSITSSGATISWTTNASADSQVTYGTSATQLNLSVQNTALTQSHSLTLTGLQASTTYYYQVLSRDAQGRQTKSATLTFTTLNSTGGTVLFQLHSEVSGTTNGSTITPGVAPSGFTGKVVVTNGGSVNFAPAFAGNGVYFLNCCDNTSNAYYKFTGSTVGKLFDPAGGQVSFYLKSRRTFAGRLQAGSFRVAFDVRDDAVSNHLFYFLTETMSGYLIFSYRIGSTTLFYYVPKGTEDTLFGNGVMVKVTITWDGKTAKLYLNDTLVNSGAYQSVTPNWTAASVFDIGAQEYLTYGGYNSLDDIIDEFTVTGH